MASKSITASEREILKHLEASPQNEGMATVANLNPEILLLAGEDSKFREALNDFDIKIVDGFGVCLVVFVKHFKKIARTPGADLAGKVLKTSVKRGLKVGLVNKSGGLSAQADLEERFAGIPSIEVFQLGEDDNYAEFAKKNLQEADVVLAGLGAPEQEKFIAEAKKALPNLKLAMGVGGTLDYWSGKQKRAPLWLRKLGLEWLFRFYRHPRRAGRIFRATIIFPAKALLDKKEATKK